MSFMARVRRRAQTREKRKLKYSKYSKPNLRITDEQDIINSDK